MEDKMFAMMEKMYGEFIKRFDGLDERFDKLENEMKENTKAIKKVEIVQEKMYEDIKLISEVILTNEGKNKREHQDIKKEANERFVVIEGVLKTK